MRSPGLCGLVCKITRKIFVHTSTCDPYTPEVSRKFTNFTEKESDLFWILNISYVHSIYYILIDSFRSKEKLYKLCHRKKKKFKEEIIRKIVLMPFLIQFSHLIVWNFHIPGSCLDLLLDDHYKHFNKVVSKFN